MPGLRKDESIWPIAFRLAFEEKQIGRWPTLSWSIEDVCLYDQDKKKMKLPNLKVAHSSTRTLPR